MSVVAPAYEALTWVPYPVLVVDAAGVVCHANPKAAALFPALHHGAAHDESVPAWLVDAHARRTTTAPSNGAPGDSSSVSGPVGERSFEAHPTVQDDGR
ncbi:hypothetical protein [Streptomyces sp. NPDC055056]